MTDWLQAGGNAARTGYTPDALGTGVAVNWRYDFHADPFAERVHWRVQPLIAGDRVIVPTLGGRVFALQATFPDFANYAPGWSPVVYITLGVPIAATPAIDATYIHVPTIDGNVHALTLADGSGVHHSYVGVHSAILGPITAAPCLAAGQLMLVDHWGQVTSLDPATYAINWQRQITGSYGQPMPLRMTPAYDGTRLIIGRLDMHVMALDPADAGATVWTTEDTLSGAAWPRLVGSGFTDYWPVCTADGLILLRPVAQYADNDSTSWSSLQPTLRGVPVDDYLDGSAQTARLSDVDANPTHHAPTLHVLDGATGVLQPYPIHWSWITWMHGPGAPCAMAQDGQAVIMSKRSPAEGDPGQAYMGGHGLLDVRPASGTYRHVTANLIQVNGARFAGYSGYGNRDENMTQMCAGNKVVISHTLGFENTNPQGVFDRDTGSWTDLPAGPSNQRMYSVAEPSAAAPLSSANGWLYQVALGQLIVRKTT